jgi:hypothetical protein
VEFGFETVGLEFDRGVAVYSAESADSKSGALNHLKISLKQAIPFSSNEIDAEAIAHQKVEVVSLTLG